MLKQNKIAILFTHHSNNEVVSYNYNKLKENNPNTDIYKIGFSCHDLLEGSFKVEKDQEWLPKNNLLATDHPDKRKLTEADLFIYDFVDKNDFDYDKYLIIEWDTYCNCSIEEFYKDALQKNFFCHNIIEPEEVKEWYWYKRLYNYQKQIPLLCGVYPTSGLLVSKQKIKQIIEILKNNPRQYDNLNSEMRLGCLLKQTLEHLDIAFDGCENFITYHGEGVKFNKNTNGYFHPIKHII
jgi:hypothetical protein